MSSVEVSYRAPLTRALRWTCAVRSRRTDSYTCSACGAVAWSAWLSTVASAIPPEGGVDLGDDRLDQRIPTVERLGERRRIARCRPRLPGLCVGGHETHIVDELTGAHRIHEEVLANPQPVGHRSVRPAHARGGHDAPVRNRP